MRFRPTPLPGVLVVEPDVHRDDRGFFLETYHRQKYRDGGIEEAFVQDNHSRSARGTLRGLHAQRTRPQGKLVRAVRGRIWDVAVDIRRDSPTFRRWYGEELNEDNHWQLWVPPGFAHGFYVLSAEAEVVYKCTDLYLPEDEITLRWDDPEIGIEWPGWPLGKKGDETGAPRLSRRDAEAPRLADLLDWLPVYPNAAAEPSA